MYGGTLVKLTDIVISDKMVDEIVRLKGYGIYNDGTSPDVSYINNTVARLSTACSLIQPIERLLTAILFTTVYVGCML